MNIPKQISNVGLWIAISIFLLTVVGFLFFIKGWQKQNLLQYTNKELGVSLEYPTYYSINSISSSCVHFVKGNIRISIGLTEVAGCFPSGIGQVTSEKTVDNYSFSVGGRSYPLRDVKLTAEGNIDIWGMILQEKLYWLTLQNGQGEELGIFYTMPETEYGNSVSEIRTIIKSIELLNSNE